MPSLQSNFADRHIGPSPRDIEAMLATLNASSLDQLIEQTVPAAILYRGHEDLGAPMSETEALAHLRELANRNEVFTSFIGMGYYGTHTPGVILRNILENPAWYTAYTPYQPEISQGRLEALLNYQTMITDLTGLDIANASLLDEATAGAEAMAVARRVAKAELTHFFVDADVHPQTLAVIETRAEPLGIPVTTGDPMTADFANCFAAIFQYPGSHGAIRDLRGPIAKLKAQGGVAIVAADPLALTILASPAELGAEIAIGSTQRFGVPMGYGGPHAAYMAVKDAFKRHIPGRLVGVSIDARGNSACRLSLQTREQHIRREKAMSNICTAQVLLAVMASMYAVYHGPEGLTAIARRVNERAAAVAAGVKALGFALESDSFFDTVTVCTGAKTAEIAARALALRMNFRVEQDRLGISVDETTTQAHVELILEAFGGQAVTNGPASIPAGLARASAFLAHPVFHRYRSETEMLRYLRRLNDRDLALDRAMIPLGSCTMKLNATTEMIPVTWPEFGALHPFAPKQQAQGYQAMFERLEKDICAVTGYDAVSLQPNSGAQGEYAGLLAIRGYHVARGEANRKVCLIPSSAHGTNPASAHMVGYEVVVVNCDSEGNVDLADLQSKAAKYSSELAAVMVTYPSTHGVFEEQIRELCDITHRHGGQVYMDGANLNAQVGISCPGDFGADVSHLNLHKTFCIPHGGGGPGMGPIGVKSHLAPYLPGGPGGVGPVSAAPYGSASILPISYTYIRMMGWEGLRRATQVAILNANYVAERLKPHYPILYTNRNGRVAHECILDPRPLKDLCGVSVDDIAKRLIDYGFHAPTMSFPVAGTLMIEPTESESKYELDRFIDAMISIREEIRAVENGRLTIEQSPLRFAPHTTQDIADDNWTRSYSRAEGCFPKGTARVDKYWPPVSRIDNAYGDRNLVCVCPPVEEYQEYAGASKS
jgi:glycine dehydrogenase